MVIRRLHWRTTAAFLGFVMHGRYAKGGVQAVDYQKSRTGGI